MTDKTLVSPEYDLKHDQLSSQMGVLNPHIQCNTDIDDGVHCDRDNVEVQNLVAVQDKLNAHAYD